LKGADNTYVVFGEAKIQDFSSLGAEQEAKRFASEQPVATEKAAETKPAEEVKGAEEGEELSEEGLKAEDIETLISHTSCTRREAVKALRETNGDSVAAIIVNNTFVKI